MEAMRRRRTDKRTQEKQGQKNRVADRRPFDENDNVGSGSDGGTKKGLTKSLFRGSVKLQPDLKPILDNGDTHRQVVYKKRLNFATRS